MASFHQSREWKQFRSIWRPRYQADIDSGGVRCLNCPGYIHTGQAWDIGHVSPGVAYMLDAGYSFAQLCDPELTHPAHRKCNQADGARIGHARTKTKQSIDRGHFTWQ